MSTPPTQAAWPGGVITAAGIAVILSAPVICPPPSGDGVVAMSKSGDPGC